MRRAIARATPRHGIDRSATASSSIRRGATSSTSSTKRRSRTCADCFRSERKRMARQEHLAEGIYESDLTKSAWRGLIRAAGLRDVRVVSAGVYPPYTLRGHEALTWRYGSFMRALDGTVIADVLGFFYMATARKPRR